VAKTVVVTGGTRGIGAAIVAAVVRAGGEVVFVGRDRERGEALATRLGARARFVRGDLGTLSGAAEVAAEITREVDASGRARAAGAPGAIDVLVHNAGIWPSARVVGPDGFEASFVTNHLAPFVLTSRLGDLIPRGGRIVQVSAGIAAVGRYDLDKTPRGLDFSRLRTYANTKLANLMATRRWAEVLGPRGIDVNAIHPGVVRTGLGASRGPLGWVLAVAKLAWSSPERGAEGPVRLAMAPELSGVTGRFFDRKKEVAFPAAADDPARIEAVFAQANAIVGAGVGV